MVFYDNRKKMYAFFPPPPVVDFLGHLKKNIVQRNVAEKKIRARKIAQPLPQISNGPSLS
jgi:hypothetical protein